MSSATEWSPPTSTSTGSIESMGGASTSSSRAPLLSLPLVPLSIVTTSFRAVKVGVLLDGDADYFTRAYTSKGRQGGRCAALELKNAVERYIRKEHWANAKHVQIDIMAFSFVNMKGLSNYLGDDIPSFAQGFNSSPFAFSMSDVGDVSQGADIALKGHLAFLLSTCDHVLFGGAHDAGYVVVLSTAAARDKVTLVRTTPYCAEKILLLGLEEVRFPGLFEGTDPTERSRKSVFPLGPLEGSTGGVGTLAIAPRSYSNVASSPVAPAILSPGSPDAGDATLSDYDFRPLVRLLLAHALPPHPEERPLRGRLAYDLKCLARPPIDFGVAKEFRKYSLEAERRGIVELGVGGLEGSEWIRLRWSHAEARAYLKCSPPSSVVTTRGTSEEDGAPSFCVLVQVLRACPDARARFSVASSKMIDRGAKLWEPGQFAAYVDAAVAARIVETSQVEGERFEFWPQYRLTRSNSSSSSPVAAVIPRGGGGRQLGPARSPSTVFTNESSASRGGGRSGDNDDDSGETPIPAKFVPLVAAFVHGRLGSATPHSLASRLTAHGNKPFESGKWQEYLDEAHRLGIVKFAYSAGGVQWVKLDRTRA
ncbi:hypothetical protein JCM11491_003783 [Sporobolomyces phaffii]